MWSSVTTAEGAERGREGGKEQGDEGRERGRNGGKEGRGSFRENLIIPSVLARPVLQNLVSVELDHWCWCLAPGSRGKICVPGLPLSLSIPELSKHYVHYYIQLPPRKFDSVEFELGSPLLSLLTPSEESVLSTLYMQMYTWEIHVTILYVDKDM